MLGTSPSSVHEELLATLFDRSPFDGFDHRAWPQDEQGWGSTDPNFAHLVTELRPQLIIEVGTWKGGSALHMGRLARESGLNCTILCVDTWLGAIEFWEDHADPERYGSLAHLNGYPRVYYQFLANVMHAGLEQTIVPFPQASLIAARWLRNRGYAADLVYVDGSHEEDDCLLDLASYWPIVRAGGIIFGDDYDEYWPSVRKAVDEFSRSNGLEVSLAGRHWMIKKTTLKEVKGTPAALSAEVSRLDTALAEAKERSNHLERQLERAVDAIAALNALRIVNRVRPQPAP